MTAVSQMKAALVQIVANLGIVPTTTLSASPAIGAGQLTVASTTGFVPGGLIRWLDGTAERPYLIADLDPVAKTITLDTGRSGGTIQFTHSAGAQIVTNLTTALPASVTSMITGSGYPVISINALDRVKRREMSREWQPRNVVSMAHLLPIALASGSGLDPQLWTEQITDRAEADIAAIETYLQSGAGELIPSAGGAPTAQWIDRLATSARPNVKDYGTPVWETWLDIQVAGISEPM